MPELLERGWSEGGEPTVSGIIEGQRDVER